MTQPIEWTVVTRKARSRQAFTPTGFRGTWHEAVEEARSYYYDAEKKALALEVWFVAVGDARIEVDGRWYAIEPEGERWWLPAAKRGASV